MISFVYSKVRSGVSKCENLKHQSGIFSKIATKIFPAQEVRDSKLEVYVSTHCFWKIVKVQQRLHRVGLIPKIFTVLHPTFSLDGYEESNSLQASCVKVSILTCNIKKVQSCVLSCCKSAVCFIPASQVPRISNDNLRV